MKKGRTRRRIDPHLVEAAGLFAPSMALILAAKPFGIATGDPVSNLLRGFSFAAPHKHKGHRMGGLCVCLVEAAGIEPASASPTPSGSTCVACYLFDGTFPNRQGHVTLSLLGFNADSTGTRRRGPEDLTSRSRLTGAA